jgi:hypothetical protein
LLALIVTGWAAAAAGPPPPIVNGAPEAEFPTVVSLGADLFGERVSLCTANLITTRLVLTAAHCTDFISAELLAIAGRAYVGPDIWNPTYELELSDRYVHPDYVELDNDLDELGEFDISLVVLAEDAPLRPMWLRLEPLSDDLLGSDMTSIGFGLDEDEVSGVKRSASFTLDDLDDQFLLSESSTNPGNATICSGDSGGPQVALVNGEWEQWGVHSWGDSYCRYLSGSQRVDVALDWVLDHVEEVHGTRDLCVANGWAGDGSCDEVCEQYGEVDPDCLPPEEEGEDDSTDSPSKAKSGCSAVPVAPLAAWGWLAVPLAFVRRRPCRK